MQITLLGGGVGEHWLPPPHCHSQWLRNLPAPFITKNTSVSNAKATCPSLDVSSHSPATPWLCHRCLVLHYKLSSGREALEHTGTRVQSLPSHGRGRAWPCTEQKPSPFLKILSPKWDSHNVCY